MVKFRGVRAGDLDIAVGHPSAQVVARQLERHLAIGDVDIRVVIDRLEVCDEAVHEAQRVDEILEFEGS